MSLRQRCSLVYTTSPSSASKKNLVEKHSKINTIKMTPEMIFILVVILVAVGLMISNRIRPDLVALIVLLVLGLSGMVHPDKVFSGFSSSAIMIILGISMISISLQQTGAANMLGRFIYRIGGRNEVLLIFLVSLTSAVLSLFMNNIAAVGVLLPAVMSLSRRSKTSPSRLLIPLAFGTILGGMATLLTTSNIIISGALKDAGQPSFGLLDYFPVGGPTALVGILFITFIGYRLLPKGNPRDQGMHKQGFADKMSEFYHVDTNLIHLEILPGSQMANRTIAEGNWLDHHNLNILAVFRGKEQLCAPPSDTILLPGDAIIARGRLDSQTAEDLGLHEQNSEMEGSQLASDTHPFAEVVISPHSQLIGKSIKEIMFRERYSLNIIALWREGNPIHADLSNLVLRFGDALLVQGPASQIHDLQGNSDLLLLQEDPDAILLPRKGAIAIVITLVTLVTAALDILPVAQVVLSGAVLLILTGCMTLNDAFRGIEWKAIFLIAGLWPLSIAVQETGLASYAINWLLGNIGAASSIWVAAIFLFVTMLLTLMISSQVSAIIMIPLAITAAAHLGIDPRPFALATAMGCSLAFMTPIGHPVNIMVMNPGGYSFKDYFRIGFPLTILVFITILITIQVFWGL